MKNKRVGIVTFCHGNYNYGGQLQAFALQHVIEEEGFHADVINFTMNYRKKVRKKLKALGFIRTLRIFIVRIRQKLLRTFSKNFKDKIDKREALFMGFEESIKSSIRYRDDNLEQLNHMYDIFVAGSDQVWNQFLWNDFYLLSFVKNKRKIAYAASIGDTPLRISEERTLKRAISDYHAISMREISAKETVQKLLGREIICTLDPTLLFDSSFWINEAKPYKIKEPYVFAFFPEKKGGLEDAYNYCKKKNVRMVTMPHLQGRYSSIDEKYKDIVVYDAGPREWISIVMNAELVFTSSFHGTAFSLIFHKQFCVMSSTKNHNEYNLRIGSLLSQVGLMNRINNVGKPFDESSIEASIDYRQVEDVLVRLRSKSMNFLCEALNNGT